MSRNEHDIITVSHYFYPRVGGLEVMAYELSNHLSREGFRVLSIYGGDANRKSTFSNFANREIKLFSVFNATYPIPGLRFIFTVLSAIIKNPQAKVLIHDRHLLPSVVTAMLCKLLGREYILISHTNISNYFESKVFELIGKCLESIVFSSVVRSAANVICVSESNKDYLIEKLGLKPSRATVIYNGFNTNHISKYQIKPKEKIVVFATKWIPVKDPDTAAVAFYELAKKYSDWKFYFIGVGQSIIDNFIDMPKNLIVERYFYDKNNLYELLSKSYIYVNSSLNEGLPVAVLEAAALGNHLVLSDAPSNIELAKHLKQVGSVFKRTDSETLAEKISQLIENFAASTPEINKLSELAYSKFSDTQVFQQYTKFISGDYSYRGLKEKGNFKLK